MIYFQWADPEHSDRGAGGGGHGNFFCHQRISQRSVRTVFEKQSDPRGLIASHGGSVPEYLRKSIATCKVRTPYPHPLDPPMLPSVSNLLIQCALVPLFTEGQYVRSFVRVSQIYVLRLLDYTIS